MNHRTHHNTHPIPAPFSTTVEWANAALGFAAAAGLLFYVITATGLSAQAWRFADAQDELAALLEQRNGLVAQQSELEDRAVLSALAVQAGMVPAGSVVYLVEEQSVAAR